MLTGSSTLSLSPQPVTSTLPASTSILVDTNANPKQRNVAFGKLFDHHHYNQQGTTNPTTITTTQMLSSSSLSSPQPQNRFNFYQLNGFQKLRGFSVPNLGFFNFFEIFTFLFLCF